MIRTTIATISMLLGCLMLVGSTAQAIAQQEAKDFPQPASGAENESPDSTVDDRTQDDIGTRRAAGSAAMETRDPSQHAALGVMLVDSPDGPWITSVYVGSPAARIGLRTDDVIVGINEQSCHTVGDVTRVIRAHRAGDDVTLEISRDHQLHRLPVTLAARGSVFGPSTDLPHRRYRAFRPQLDPYVSIDQMMLRIEQLEADVEGLRQQLTNVQRQLRTETEDAQQAPLDGGAIQTNQFP